MVSLDRAQTVFLNALEITSESAREAYLQAECRDDSALRQEVDGLLDHAGRLGGFMEGRTGRIDAGTNPALDLSPVITAITIKPGTRIGPYKIREQIGEGGMGAVYVAEQSKPVRRKVALKIVKPGMATKDVLARFEAERQALAIMNHPSIARVFDGGATETGQPYFVMELVHGIPITEFCDNKKLSTRDRLTLFLDVCGAIQHAHQRGIIHRDLKPSNVLIAEIDGKPAAKVIDFGVAKAVSHKLTEKSVYTNFTQMIGTPLYMSPEQATLGVIDVDTRSDVYSLGVMLYELLTGQTPFDRDLIKHADIDEVRRVLREEEPKRPSAMVSTLKAEALTTLAERHSIEPRSLSRTLNGELDWLTMKALDKDRERRYESVRAFADDIERYLGNLPILACPPSSAYKLRKLAQRHGAALATVSLVVVLLVAGIASTTWQAIKAVTERDRAIAAEERAVEESAIVKAINEFVENDLLGMADMETQSESGMQPDPNVKLRTVLDRAAQQISVKFKEQTLVEAAIRMVIGKSYQSLGEFALAIPHFQTAKELRAEHLGLDEEGTIDAELSLLRCRRSETRLSTDIDISRLAELVKKCEIASGSDAPITLRALEEHAAAHLKRGNLVEGEKLLREVVTRRQQSLGPEHPDSLSSMSLLGDCLINSGRYSEAEELIRKVHAIQQRILGTEHPDSLGTAMRLAVAIHLAGRFAEAEKLIRQSLAIMERVLGPQHPNTLLGMLNLARFISTSSRQVEAEKMYRELLEIVRDQRGPEHPSTLEIMLHLAFCMERLGRLTEAEAMMSNVLEMEKRVLGSKHRATLDTQIGLAGLVNRLGRHAEAERLCREVMGTIRSDLGSTSQWALSANVTLAGIIERQGRHSEAESLLRELVEPMKQTMGPTAPTTISCLNLLATAVTNGGEFAEGERLFLEVHDLYIEVFGAEHLATLEVQEKLGVAVGQQGRFQDSARILRQALEIGQDVPGLGHPVLTKAAQNLAASNGNWLERVLDKDNAKENEVRELLDSTEFAVALFPDDRQHLLNLATALYLNQQWQESLANFEKSISLGAILESNQNLFQAICYWHVGKPELALQNYSKVAAVVAGTRPGPRTEVLLKLREESEQLFGIDEGRREKLVADFYDQIDATDLQALTQRGRWHHFNSQHEKAIEDLSAALELSPDSPGIGRLRMRGDSYSALSQYQDAIQDYSRALELDSSDEGKSWTLAMRATAYQRQCLLELALEDSSNSIPLRPNPSSARHHYLQRAQIYRDLHEYENALADCRKSIDIAPEEDTQWFSRQEAYVLRGDIFAEDLQQYDNALAEYDKALELDPENKNYVQKRATAVQAMDQSPPVPSGSNVTL